MSLVTSSKGQSICLVDDDDSVRGAFRFLLRTHGFDVVDYASPLALLKSEKMDGFSCYVLDMHMPTLSGLELLNTLRKRGVRTPVVIVTGREDSLLRTRAEAAGAAALLAKPVDSDQLVLTVRQAIAHKPQQTLH